MLDYAYALEDLSTALAAIIYYALRRYITHAFVRHRCVVNMAIRC